MSEWYKQAGIVAVFVVVGLLFWLGNRNDIYEQKPIIEEDSTSVENRETEETNKSEISEGEFQNMTVRNAAADEVKLRAMISALGVEQVMLKLEEESGGGAAWDCHQEAHEVGREGYTIYKESAFGTCNPSCHSGCYHGAMEAFLTEEGTKNLASNINRICSAFETSFGKFECLHGVGHGVLAYLSYDLPGALMECDELEGGFSQSSCYGGVFMENIMTGLGLGARGQFHETDWVKDDDPHFPCNAIGEDSSKVFECYQMQTSWILYLNGYQFDKTVDECLRAPGHMVPVCFKSLGRDAAGHTLRNPERMKEVCALVPNENNYRNQCVEGSVNVVVDFWGPRLGSQASEYCSILDGSEALHCFTTLARRLPSLYKDVSDRMRVCDTFDDDYKHLCQT